MSVRNQIDHYPLEGGGTLTIVPGLNVVDGAELKAAIARTDGNDAGFRARVSTGEYTVRMPQVATGKWGG
jgi:hypothetical protein